MSLALIIVKDLITKTAPAAKIPSSVPIIMRRMNPAAINIAPAVPAPIPAVVNQRRRLTMVKSQMLNVQKGFTLIELLLYVSIVGAIIVAVAGFLSLRMQSRVKKQAISEVEQQGVQVMQVSTQNGRNATNINFSSVCDLSGGTIRQNTIALTNSRVVASNLTFQNLSRTGTPGTIRVQFTLTHINPEGRNEYNYSKTFYGSASLR